MTQRTSTEKVLMAIGAVIAVVVAALLGLAGYALLGPTGLSESNAYIFGAGVLALVLATLAYGGTDIIPGRDTDQRRLT